MGANKNSDLQKCGEILIDIKKIKHKTKSYTYRCAFCDVDCEQIKKFTKHLQDKHFRNFEHNQKQDDDPSQMEPECSNLSSDTEDFKIDQQIYIVETNDHIITPNNTIGTNVHCDPLNMVKIENNIDCLIENSANNDDVLKIEKKDIEIPNLEANMEEACDDNDYVMSGNDCCSEKEDKSNSKDGNISKRIIIIPKTEKEPNPNKKKRKRIRKINRDISDISSDDSRDSDFDLEKEINSNKKPKKLKKENNKDAKNQNEPKEEVVEDDDNPLSRRIYKKSLPLFIEQYKKHELLWNVDNIEFGVKPVRLETLGKIAEEIKLQLKRNITVHGIHVHIKYLNRLYRKDKNKELTSKMENTEFIPESDLYTELSFLSKSQGPFLCTICNTIIPKYDSYCEHLAQHNGTPAFKCTSCEMTFAKFDKYTIHKKRHLKIYNCYCNVCGKGYVYQAELDYHMTSHTGLKPYLCSICGEGFRSRNNHAVHMLRHENRYRHVCHICNKGFMYLHALNSHVNCHLNIRDVKCKICDMGFTGKKYLKRHEQKCHSNKT